jgi:hypothetical protein
MMTPEAGRGRRLVDWGAIWAGTAWTFGVMVLFSALWLAIGFGGGGVAAFADNIEWWLAGTAVLALFVGAFVAGWSPGVRGWLPGIMNGLTVWGLLLTIGLIVGIPSILGGAAIIGTGGAGGLADAGQGIQLGSGSTGLWATFWTALIGFGTALGGGALGGGMGRTSSMFETMGDDSSLRIRETATRR